MSCSATVTIITQPSSKIQNTEGNEDDDELQCLTRLLKNKFSNQQKGKKKWLENRLDRMSGMIFDGFIPIEWMNETEMILNIIKNHEIHSMEIIPKFLIRDKVAFELVKNRICGIEELPDELLQDRDFFLDLITLDTRMLRVFDDCDEDFNAEIVSRKRNAILYVSNDKINSPTFIEKVSRFDIYLAMNLPVCKLNSECPYSLRNDKDFVMAALLINGCALEFVSDELKNDFDVIVQALSNIYAIKYLPDHYFQDLDFLRRLILKRPSVIEFLPFTLIDNKDFIMSVVKENGRLIHHASNRLRMDRDVVIAAVSQHPNAIDSISNEFTIDKDILMILAKHKEYSFLHLATDDLKRDREFVLEIVKKQGLALQHVHPSLQSDKTIVKEAVKENELAFVYASSELKMDPDFIFELVQEGHPSILDFATLTIDQDMAMKLIKINGFCLRFLLYLIPNEEMEKEAVRQNGFAFDFTDSLYEERINYCYYGAKI